MAEEPDLYETLDLPKDATDAEIKAAYRAAARKHHPDRGGDAEEFKKIQRAYAVLSDERKRGQYDSTGEGGAHIPSNRDQALQNLALLFSNIINKNLNTLHKVDLIETIDYYIETNRQEPRKIIKEQTSRLEKLEATEKRLKRRSKKEEVNLFERILDQEKRVCRNQIRAANDALETIDIMSDIAHEYDYDFDKESPRPDYSRHATDGPLKYLEGRGGLWPYGVGPKGDDGHPGNGVPPEDDAAERRAKRANRNKL